MLDRVINPTYGFDRETAQPGFPSLAVPPRQGPANAEVHKHKHVLASAIPMIVILAEPEE